MWKISADTGGTFTDCLAETPAGEIRRVKVLSSSALRGRIRAISEDRLQVVAEESWGAPDDFLCRFSFSAAFVKEKTTVVAFDAKGAVLTLSRPLPSGDWTDEPFLVQSPEEAPVLAARLVTGTLPGQPLPDLSLRIATTRATNALLEGKGAKTVFFVTAGFADSLRIGTQQRPDLFALNIQKPPPLHAEVVEVRERLDSAGKVIEPLDFDALEEPVERLVKMGRTVGAVAFLHSYRNPEHEKRMEDFLLKRGFQYISCSHALAPLIKILPRAETAVVDASLSPIMETYLDRVEGPVGRRVRIMTSAGGLVTRAAFRSSDSLLSGPAGGVVGAAAAGRQAGFTKIISFDMGGTSSDVARFDGDFEYSFEQRVGDAHLLAPSLKIETVASGGGSVCSFDGNQLRIGPESAGASPGPACYGGGGPLSLTDVHLLLGRIDSRRFGVPVFPGEARARLEELLRKIENAGQIAGDGTELLEGFLTIANERMADAIRKISLREGVDPADYALVAFGGAGGLHACAVSEELGIGAVVWPKDAGILSAVGLRRAVAERFAQKQVLQVLSPEEGEVSAWIDELSREAIEALLSEEETSEDEIVLRRRLVDLRLRGQETGI
ncbi:MAG TPA: hydantoinase/oxoprolinase family protein, partial [Opitutales bacterium]|nr:hydantoinase/oxoprolinase family protein [Opitutales bacterium]